MAVHALSQNFAYLLTQINPASTYQKIASSELRNVRRLLEDVDGPAGALVPTCFTQGSYRQETAIHTINDLDIVALCTALNQPPVRGSWGGSSGQSYSRDDIFRLLAAALAEDHRYRGKIRYRAQSLCIKIDLSIKVEILPAVLSAPNADAGREPFRMYRPELGRWVDGYARRHRALMAAKNAVAANFYVPMVKILKHLRDTRPGFNPHDAVSFHIECLLYHLPDYLYFGSPADVIPRILAAIADFPLIRAFQSGFRSPCGDKVLFSDQEWDYDAYARFHSSARTWGLIGEFARDERDEFVAISYWKMLLGAAYFPSVVREKLPYPVDRWGRRERNVSCRVPRESRRVGGQTHC